MRVLMRWGIENYFSQSAMENAMKAARKTSDLKQYFPLPEDKAVDEHVSQFTKKLNKDVASHMTLKDLGGTYLADIFGEISQRIRS